MPEPVAPSVFSGNFSGTPEFDFFKNSGIPDFCVVWNEKLSLEDENHRILSFVTEKSGITGFL